MIQFFGSGSVRKVVKFDAFKRGFCPRDADSSVIVVDMMRGEFVHVLARSVFSLQARSRHRPRPVVLALAFAPGPALALARLCAAARTVGWRGGGRRPRSAGIRGPGGPVRNCK